MHQRRGHVPLFNCVCLGLGRMLDFSEPQFPYLYSGHKDVLTFSGWGEDQMRQCL